MPMKRFTESEIETFAVDELIKLGFYYTPGPSIAPDNDTTNKGSRVFDHRTTYNEPEKRKSYDSVILTDMLEYAINLLNPQTPEKARQEALKTVAATFSPQLIDANETFHKLLTEGVPVSVQKNHRQRGERLWLIDFQNPDNNTFYAINQFTVQGPTQDKRPDIILFINGLPLVIIELKNPADQNATIRKAYDQIQNYKTTIPSLFFYNAFCIISDGLEAKAGTISSPFSRFQGWKTSDGKKEASPHVSQIETLINGMLNKTTLLDIIQNFIVFEKDKRIDAKTGLTQVETVKKIAAYHQYYAVNKALASTRAAAAIKGNRKAGVIWHTQGSGKSLTMVFYAAKLVHNLDNPTIILITDRNDLDQQLFDTFVDCKTLLGQEPGQAESREDLKKLLKVASGGIVFTTIHKFFPDNDGAVYDLLSERRNIIVIADEAHRTQYGFKAKLIDARDKTGKPNGKRITYGFAKFLRDAVPNATFIGFTGTPVESADINTPAVFGHYIDIYDIAQSIEDGATVKIYYESRLAKINLTEEGRKLIAELDKEIAGDNAPETQQAKAKWTKLEAIIGHPERLKNLARDIISHYETRSQIIEGKAMIVAMSRRIAVALHDAIIALRPQWHDENLQKGTIKVVMTSASADKMEFDPEDPESLVIPLCHRTTKQDRRLLAGRMKDPGDPLKLVIVRDMWLTGFDVPCLHTIYIDKLMTKHTLIQAISRVNRVYKDKPGGLVVDYIGIGSALKEALSFYSHSGGKGNPAETQENALALLQEKMEIVRQMFHRFDYRDFFGDDTSRRLSIILQAEEFILAREQGKNRFIKESTALSKLFALVYHLEEARAYNEEIAFFGAVRARLLKFESDGDSSGIKNYETIIRQIVNQAVESTGVVDIFDAAGIKKPDISLLSEEFLQEVKGMKNKNLGLELLKKILNDEINARRKFNITQGKDLLDMLESSIKKYSNNLLTTAEIIEELVEIARKIKDADGMAERLNLTRDEYAFYTALGINDSAIKILGDEVLATIAREIADKVRKNATIDWAMKESARAKLMVIVRRTLNHHGYPPDKQQKAVDTVLKQAEVLADYWVIQ